MMFPDEYESIPMSEIAFSFFFSSSLSFPRQQLLVDMKRNEFIVATMCRTCSDSLALFSAYVEASML